MGWRPELGKLDKYGNEIEDREYTQVDFDRILVLEKRTKEVAKRIILDDLGIIAGVKYIGE